MLTLVCVYAGLCLCMHNGLNLIQNISLVFAYPYQWIRQLNMTILMNSAPYPHSASRNLKIEYTYVQAM